MDTLRRRLGTLEQSVGQKDLAARDKDELIRALYSRLELAKTNREVRRCRVTPGAYIRPVSGST